MGIEMRVANDVFRDYDPGIRPIKDVQEPINVTIKVELYEIVSLVSGTFNLLLSIFHYCSPLRNHF